MFLHVAQFKAEKFESNSFFKNEFLLCKLLSVLLKVKQDLIVGLKRCHLKIRLPTSWFPRGPEDLTIELGEMLTVLRKQTAGKSIASHSQEFIFPEDIGECQFDWRQRG